MTGCPVRPWQIKGRGSMFPFEERFTRPGRRSVTTPRAIQPVRLPSATLLATPHPSRRSVTTPILPVRLPSAALLATPHPGRRSVTTPIQPVRLPSAALLATPHPDRRPVTIPIQPVRLPSATSQEPRLPPDPVNHTTRRRNLKPEGRGGGGRSWNNGSLVSLDWGHAPPSVDGVNIIDLFFFALHPKWGGQPVA